MVPDGENVEKWQISSVTSAVGAKNAATARSAEKLRAATSRPWRDTWNGWPAS